MSTSNTYWKDRETAARHALLSKSEKEIDKKLKKYYIKLSKSIIRDYESLYAKILLKQAAGEEIAPANLYQLDKYWVLQAQVKKRLDKYGAYQQSLFSKVFEAFFKKSYNAYAIPGLQEYNTLDDVVIKQVIESVWCADGKSWSQRIWKNTAKLQQTLEEGLLECVGSGRSTDDLLKTLQSKFNASYSRAETLVRTELAHIQTEAARQRYINYGIQEYEFYADEDERRCKHCGQLHEKRFPIHSTPKVPLHANCRCVILPVID